MPGRLLAVAQGGVEDLHVVGHGLTRCSLGRRFSVIPGCWIEPCAPLPGNEKPPRPKGTRRRPRAPGGCSQLRKEEALGAQFLRHEPSMLPDQRRDVNTMPGPRAVRQSADAARSVRRAPRAHGMQPARATRCGGRTPNGGVTTGGGLEWEPQPFPYLPQPHTRTVAPPSPPERAAGSNRSTTGPARCHTR